MHCEMYATGILFIFYASIAIHDMAVSSLKKIVKVKWEKGLGEILKSVNL